jgi:NADPH:quinone reductase-like Zn-dependent oxidoreductase
MPGSATTALQAVRDHANVRPGQHVLVIGASGGVGTFAVQIAKSFGAAVTGVCSTRNVDMLRSIGADHVIDYTQDDFTQSGQRYDLILDCIANHSLSACRRVLNPNGTYVIVGGPTGRWMIGLLARLIKALVLSRFVSQKPVIVLAKSSKADLAILHDLMKAGKVTPVIDRRYSLREVPEAVRYLEEGHARGKVVITLESDNKT